MALLLLATGSLDASLTTILATAPAIAASLNHVHRHLLRCVSSEQSTAATIPACLSEQAGPLSQPAAAWCLQVVRPQKDSQQGGEALQETEEAVGEVETVPFLKDVLDSKLLLLVLFVKNEDGNECTCLSSAKSVDIANY